MADSSESSKDEALLFEKRRGVATLTLNRPAARNAITDAMFLDAAAKVQQSLLPVPAEVSGQSSSTSHTPSPSESTQQSRAPT